MPVTPFHAGIPGLLSCRWPHRVDIFTAAVGSVICDVDFFFFLALGTPLHGFLHTFAGASAAAAALVLLAHYFRGSVVRIKEWLAWETVSNPGSLALGAFIGTFSHVLLDSLIYTDMDPFHPIEGNPFHPASGERSTFITVYAITGITTFILLVLYNHKYMASLGRKDESGSDPG